MAEKKKGGKRKSEISSVIVTPIMRASFPSVHKPDTGGQFSKGDYRLDLCLPKEEKDKLKPLKQLCLKTAQKHWKGIKFNDLKTPIKDGDEREGDNAAYEGCVYFNAHSNRKPGIVGPDRQPLEEDQEVYGGCFVRVSLVVATYERTEQVKVREGSKTKTVKEKVKGVTFYLNNVQFVKDGERLGGGSGDPTEDFDEIDPSEYDDISEDEDFEETEEEEVDEEDDDDDFF